MVTAGSGCHLVDPAATSSPIAAREEEVTSH